MHPAVGPTAAGSYLYEWALFTDWCAAADVAPLPATLVTLAEFLGDNPAGDRVQIRRVSAIYRAHRDAGDPQPGRVTALRLALDSVRAQRRRDLARALAATARDLPFSGTSEALFGRRDAVLLLLTAAGLSYRSIAELASTDITVDDDDSLWIGGGHRLRIDSGTVPGFEPARVWRRWNEVLVFADRYPSTTLILQHLRAGTFPDVTDWAQRPSPVAAPIDRRGHMPYPVWVMSTDAIADVVDAHRAGAPPRRTPIGPVRAINQAAMSTSWSNPLQPRMIRRHWTPATTRPVCKRAAAHTPCSPSCRRSTTRSKTASMRCSPALWTCSSTTASSPSSRADLVQSGPGSNGLT